MLRKLLIFSIIPLLLIVPGIAFGTEMGEMEITPYPKNFQIQLVISPSEFSNHVLELINPEGKVVHKENFRPYQGLDIQIFDTMIDSSAFSLSGDYKLIMTVGNEKTEKIFEYINPKNPKIVSNDNNQNSVNSIPSWIKNNAGWWADGTIDDSAFIQGIQFLVKENILQIPPTTVSANSENKEIPSWIKNNAGWWADGTIDDSAFIQGIQFLIKEGIIQIKSSETTTNDKKIDNKEVEIVSAPETIPSYILFTTDINGSGLDFSLGFYDDSGNTPRQGKQHAMDGLVTISIDTPRGNIYKNSLSITKNDFVWDYSNSNDELRFYFYIPGQNFESNTYEKGKMTITFQSPIKNFKESTLEIPLPTVSREVANFIDDPRTKVWGKTEVVGPLEMTIKRIGFIENEGDEYFGIQYTFSIDDTENSRLFYKNHVIHFYDWTLYCSGSGYYGVQKADYDLEPRIANLYDEIIEPGYIYTSFVYFDKIGHEEHLEMCERLDIPTNEDLSKSWFMFFN